MSRPFALTLILLLGPVASLPAQTARSEAAGLEYAVASRLEEFLGEPLFVPMQQLWEQRGGWGGVLTTKDGTVLAFQSPGGGHLRRSLDGGKTWDADILLAPDAREGRALVDETNGDVLYVNPGMGWLFRSRDHGATWSRETVEVRPDGFGNIPKLEGVAAMQCGITLAFGPKKGRLLMPGRIMGPKNSNAVEWRPYHYSTALYSDDGGAVWQVSQPFPVLGTGEAALAELSDGRILYNSRSHMSRGNRYLAHSDDGGHLWTGAYRSPDLPDGPRGTSYGLMGGMIRLPLAGYDILLYSNSDTDAGMLPSKVGGSVAAGREKITVWGSFDGGKTWPVKRLVFDGPSAYSNLGVGRKGTPSEGRVYLVFEGGPRGSHAAVQVVSFNLSWLLDGRDIATLTGKGR
jgi:sialidase-1